MSKKWSLIQISSKMLDFPQLIGINCKMIIENLIMDCLCSGQLSYKTSGDTHVDISHVALLCTIGGASLPVQ